MSEQKKTSSTNPTPPAKQDDKLTVQISATCSPQMADMLDAIAKVTGQQRSTIIRFGLRLSIAALVNDGKVSLPNNLAPEMIFASNPPLCHFGLDK